jgi:hypothetical protein
MNWANEAYWIEITTSQPKTSPGKDCNLRVVPAAGEAGIFPPNVIGTDTGTRTAAESDMGGRGGIHLTSLLHFRLEMGKLTVC